MKKHDEGYTLILVMIVLVVLCGLSAFLLTSGLRNLEAQKTAEARMQDRYTAQGEIEKVVGQLNALIGASDVQTFQPELPEEGAAVRVQMQINADDGTLTMAVESGSIRIDCVITLYADSISIDEDEDTDSCTIENLTGLAYTSYEINYVHTEEAADEET